MRYVNMARFHLRNDDRSFQSSHGTPNTMAKNITAGHTLLCMQQERGVGHEGAERSGLWGSREECVMGEQRGVGHEGAGRSGSWGSREEWVMGEQRGVGHGGAGRSGS